MIPSEPLISVVISTINRPQLVTGAVNSALRQSLREIEVIVVIDGPDEATRQVLQTPMTICSHRGPAQGSSSIGSALRPGAPGTGACSGCFHVKRSEEVDPPRATCLPTPSPG